MFSRLLQKIEDLNLTTEEKIAIRDDIRLKLKKELTLFYISGLCYILWRHQRDKPRQKDKLSLDILLEQINGSRSILNDTYSVLRDLNLDSEKLNKLKAKLEPLCTIPILAVDEVQRISDVLINNSIILSANFKSEPNITPVKDDYRSCLYAFQLTLKDTFSRTIISGVEIAFQLTLYKTLQGFEV